MGYFGRIAKQSGLRVKGGQTAARPKARQLTAQTEESSGPLDREEIVMVSPQMRTLPVTKPNPTTDVRPMETPRDVTPKLTPDSSKTIEKSFGKASRQTVADAPKPLEPTLSDKGSGKIESVLPSNEREVVVKPAAVKAVLPPVLPGNVDKRMETEPAMSQKHETALPLVNISDEEAPKNFFEETSEILSGRNVEPAEIQTILLREIQEWIAAGPTPAVDPVTREILPDDDPIQIFEKKETEMTLPGVIRIGEAPGERQSESASPPNSAIEEQSFELSIGAINVTIEGETPPRQLTEIKRTEPNSREIKPESRPKGSRLSRHYL